MKHIVKIICTFLFHLFDCSNCWKQKDWLQLCYKIFCAGRQFFPPREILTKMLWDSTDFHICLGASFPVGISVCTLETWKRWEGFYFDGTRNFLLDWLSLEGYACVNFLFLFCFLFLLGYGCIIKYNMHVAFFKEQDEEKAEGFI